MSNDGLSSLCIASTLSSLLASGFSSSIPPPTDAVSSDTKLRFVGSRLSTGAAESGSVRVLDRFCDFSFFFNSLDIIVSASNGTASLSNTWYSRASRLSAVKDQVHSLFPPEGGDSLRSFTVTCTQYRASASVTHADVCLVPAHFHPIQKLDKASKLKQ